MLWLAMLPLGMTSVCIVGTLEPLINNQLRDHSFKTQENIGCGVLWI